MAVIRDLLALLPGGAPYRGPRLRGLLSGIAAEFDRLDLAIGSIPQEVMPSTSVDLLSRWENIVGLPEEGQSVPDTIEARRAEVMLRINATGGQSAAYIESVLRSSGYDARINDLNSKPFVAGSFAGQSITNNWQFVFTVEVNVSLGDSTLGAMFRTVDRIKPAHTSVVYIIITIQGPLLTEDGLNILTESGQILEA